jgi:hypothetical protein
MKRAHLVRGRAWARLRGRSSLAAALAVLGISALSAGCGGSVITLGDEGDAAPPHRPVVGHSDGGFSPPPVPEEAGLREAAVDAIAADAAPESGFDVGPVPDGLVTVPLTGCVPAYLAEVDLGGGGTYELILDTGSTTLGVASNSCSSCEVTPRYTPTPPAVDQHQNVTSPYESGSWSGEVYQDSVSAGTPLAATAMNFVAIDSQSQFFEPFQCGSSPASYQGIIGFAPSGSAVGPTTGFLDSLVAGGFAPDVFAFHLCDNGGTLWLGGFDPASVTAPPEYVPMSTSFLSDYYYLVNLSELTVNGTSVPIPTGAFPDSLIDTGSSVFILNTDAFNAVTAAITSSSAFQSAVSANPDWFENPDNCVQLTQTEAELNATLPPLTFTYGTGESGVTIQAVATESYLFDYGGYWCPALYAMDSSENFPFSADIGSPALKSAVTIIDRANRRVGFAPHAACP